jgi:hypothetical protein
MEAFFPILLLALKGAVGIGAKKKTLHAIGNSVKEAVKEEAKENIKNAFNNKSQKDKDNSEVKQ